MSGKLKLLPFFFSVFLFFIITVGLLGGHRDSNYRRSLPAFIILSLFAFYALLTHRYTHSYPYNSTTSTLSIYLLSIFFIHFPPHSSSFPPPLSFSHSIFSPVKHKSAHLSPAWISCQSPLPLVSQPRWPEEMCVCVCMHVTKTEGKMDGLSWS